MNFVITWLTIEFGSEVEHRSAEQKGHGFDFSLQTQIFFSSYHTRDKNNNIFL